MSQLKDSFNKWVASLKRRSTVNSMSDFSLYMKDLKNYNLAESHYQANNKWKKLFTKLYRNLNEFCLFSTIHGCNHLAARGRHWIEYLVWGSVLLYALITSTELSLRGWYRYQHFPTVIVMERNSRAWNITFPTGMICPQQKVDRTKLEGLAQIYGAKNVSAFVHFFTQLSISDFETFNTLPVPDYTEISPSHYLDIIIKAMAYFNYTVTSTLEGVDNDEEELLDPVFTELGVCYSYNSKIAEFFNPKSLINLNKKEPKTKDLHYCNRLDGETFAGIVKYQQSFNATILGPYEMPIFGGPLMKIGKTGQTNLDIGCLPIVSTERVRNLTVEQRKCRTRADGSLRVSSLYSYNLCLMECRMNYALQFCGCVPYFYIHKRSVLSKENITICDVPGMRCLSQNGTMLADLRDPVTRRRLPCNCYPLCTDFHFKVLEKDQNTDATNRFKWQMSYYPKTRYVRTIIYDFTDFAASVGATIGLFMGCSLLSVVELLYFFTIRLMYNKYRKWQQKRIATNTRKPIHRIDRYSEFIN